MFEFKPTEIAIIDPEPERTTFVETFVWEPATLLENRLGRLYLVGQIISSSSRQLNAETLLKLANLIKDEYYRNPGRSALTSFRFTLGKANASLDRQLKINLVVAAITKGTFMSSCLGEGITLVVRDGVVSNLESRGGTSFSNVVEGSIEPGDTIILATPQLHKVGTERLKTFTATQKLIEFLKENEVEFKNLGCIVLASRPRGLTPTSVSPPASEDTSHPKRWLTKVIIVGLVLALTIAALGYERNIAQRNFEANKILASLAQFEAETMELLKIGNFSEAERLFGEWQLQVAQLDGLGVLSKETNEAKKNLEVVEPRVKRYETVLPREVLNFKKNTLGFLPFGLTYQKNGLVVFDGQSLYNFNLMTKSGEFTLMPNGLRVEDIILHPALEDSFIVLTADAIYEYGREELRTLAPTAVGAAANRIIFYNDALYILSENAVWVLREGELTPWFKTNIAISNARDFAIDGFVYVLEESRIVKLLNGEKKDEFKADAGSERIVTESQFRRLYLLNPESGTIAVMEKSSGTVSRRLQHELLKDARRIAVSEDEKTLYVLSDEKVYSIGL